MRNSFKLLWINRDNKCNTVSSQLIKSLNRAVQLIRRCSVPKQNFQHILSKEKIIFQPRMSSFGFSAWPPYIFSEVRTSTAKSCVKALHFLVPPNNPEHEKSSRWSMPSFTLPHFFINWLTYYPLLRGGVFYFQS